MKLLARYVLRELLVPLGAWVAFLFLLLFVMQFLRGTDVLLGSAVTGADVARIVAWLSPHFLVMALPIAFLLAVLLGLGRLSEDRELLALQALGVGPLQLVAGPLAIGAALGALMLVLSATAEPWGLTAVKELVNEIIKKNVGGDVKAGTFYEGLSELVLYAERVEGEGRKWEHVLLQDGRDPSAPLLVLAQRGRVEASGPGEALQLLLEDGEVHRAGRSAEGYEVLSFERGVLSVGVGGLGRRNRFRSPKEEMTFSELLQAAEETKRQGEDGTGFLVSLHNRLGHALAPVSFALLATPLALGRRRSGRAWGYLLTLAGYAAYYLLSRLFEIWGQQGRLPPEVAGQLANGVFMSVGALLLWRLGRAGAGA